MPSSRLPDWERVLAAAVRLEQVLPDATLVRGSAAAVYAAHRLLGDADYVLPDLRECFDAVLAELEAVSGWQTARVQRLVQILGSLDGVQTGIRRLIRTAPLETIQMGGRYGSVFTVCGVNF